MKRAKRIGFGFGFVFAVVFAIGLATIGCDRTGTFVLLRVKPGPATPAGIRTLTLDLAFPDRTAHTTIADPKGAELVLPVDVALDIGGGASGMLAVQVTAADGGGTTLDAGHGTVEVIPNHTVPLEIALDQRQLPPDMAPAPDLFSCGPNEELCAGACVNKQTDSKNCGMCGRVCDSGMLCALGDCVATCPGGTTACPPSAPTYCADLTSDPHNCNGCGAECPSGQACVSSSCGCPAATPNACGTGAAALCTNFVNDANNCGDCGNVCPGGQSCVASHCVCPAATPDACGTGATAFCTRFASDPLNCGGCAVNCSAGEVCTSQGCATIDAACFSTPSSVLLGIRVTPPATNVTAAGTRQLTANGFFSADPTAPTNISGMVYWSTSNPAVATVDTAGVVTFTGAPGIATIQATLGGYTGSANVRAWTPSRLAAVSSLQVQGVPANLTHGECYRPKVVATFGTPSDTEDVTATTVWTTSGRGVMVANDLFAGIGAGSEGYYNLQAQLGAASSTLTIGIWSPAFSGTCLDQRSPGPLWGVRIAPASLSVAEDEAVALSATGVFSDGSQRDVGHLVHWQSCAPGVLDVTADGLAIGRAAGSAQAVARMPSAVGVAPVTITASLGLGAPDALSIAPPNANLLLGQQTRLVPLGAYTALPGRRFDRGASTTWSSLNPGVATVNGGVVVAVAAGVATLHASDGAQTADAHVRVWDPALFASITGFSATAPVGILTGGACEQLAATVTFNNNPSMTLDVSDSAIWTLTTPQYGSLSTGGFFTSVASDGYAVVYASLGHALLAPAVVEFGVFGSGGTCP
jgi:Bacterial Ig-like domain (group 2)/Stigma-specific protein, Stig1